MGYGIRGTMCDGIVGYMIHGTLGMMGLWDPWFVVFDGIHEILYVMGWCISDPWYGIRFKSVECKIDAGKNF